MAPFARVVSVAGCLLEGNVLRVWIDTPAGSSKLALAAAGMVVRNMAMFTTPTCMHAVTRDTSHVQVVQVRPAVTAGHSPMAMPRPAPSHLCQQHAALVLVVCHVGHDPGNNRVVCRAASHRHATRPWMWGRDCSSPSPCSRVHAFTPPPPHLAASLVGAPRDEKKVGLTLHSRPS